MSGTRKLHWRDEKDTAHLLRRIQEKRLYKWNGKRFRLQR